MNTTAADLAKAYEPGDIERKWTKRWLEAGLFHAHAASEKPPFSMVIPPPNVTSQLHIGHALDNTMQDIIARYKRMRGFETLWMPGTDHAGIATQVKVESRLHEEGVTRDELGRAGFLDRVWAWKGEYRDRIVSQLKALGSSCDWARERFTMDEGCSEAVREAFVELYRRGLIYQGAYIVNWCPHCRTTLSDIEVEHEEREGRLWHLRYPYADGDGYIVVATTRPETMLGDTAVAVNPADARHRDKVGRRLKLPLTGREIPIVADDFVEVAFGTGMVKVTPSHDPNDFELGRRHDLAQIRVIGEDARMSAEAGVYAGLDRYEARKRVVADLEKLGLLEKVEPHNHAVGCCYRCDTVVEPLVSVQWFVKMKPLAEPAIQVVKDGTVRFVPQNFSKQYLQWMENVRDWCISRQLWWGHRIPVWTCSGCGERIVAKVDPTSCPKCQGTALTQDPDVLDTWFSSALWPFSTMGWPQKTPELARFFPTDVLVTGWDIIFFWVARMIFMSLEFTGKAPFHTVLIHGLVRDAEGRKMSKSLGNGVDPMEMIEKYGADALRITLVSGTAPGNDLRFYPERVEASRNFGNKVWNATRFALMNLEGYAPGPLPADADLALADRWILSRFNRTAREVTRHLEALDLGEGARRLYDFVWSELCDWYIELVKARLRGDHGEASRHSAQAVLHEVLGRTLELLHPYMPFLTEELWQHLAGGGESVMGAKWPAGDPDRIDDAVEDEMRLVMEVVTQIRTVRSEHTVPPGRAIAAYAFADQARAERLEKHRAAIVELARLGEFVIAEPAAARPEKAVTAVAGGVELSLPLAGMIDLGEEIARLEKELAEAERLVAASNQRLANADFVAKAPEPVVTKARRQAEEYEERRSALAGRLAELKG